VKQFAGYRQEPMDSPSAHGYPCPYPLLERGGCIMLPEPLYQAADLRPAYQLRYSMVQKRPVFRFFHTLRVQRPGVMVDRCCGYGGSPIFFTSASTVPSKRSK
jgi:hypothetical protein